MKGFRDPRGGFIGLLGQIEHFGEIDQGIASRIQPVGPRDDRDRLLRQSLSFVELALAGEHLGTGRAPKGLGRPVVLRPDLNGDLDEGSGLLVAALSS